MTPEEWERSLLAATERVRRNLSRISTKEARGRTLGMGASGDNTLYADKVAEDELLKALKGSGDVRILSEEAGLMGDPGAKTLAVVDPLDGSSNFARGIPFYCTSVAIVEGDTIEDIAVGVVRDLVSGDAYSAVKGKGARRNGARIATASSSELSKSAVGVDLSKGGAERVKGLAALIGSCKRHVHFGANALELCYVADGRTDAFVDLRDRIRITDLAAAYLIASEAGAVITRADGKGLDGVFDLFHRLSFVASANEALHRQILGLCGGTGGPKAPPKGRGPP